MQQKNKSEFVDDDTAIPIVNSKADKTASKLVDGIIKQEALTKGNISLLHKKLEILK